MTFNLLHTIYCETVSKALLKSKENTRTKSDSRLRSEALLKYEGYRYTDNRFISGLVANGNIGNSQTTKQMNELRFKYEITLEGLKYAQRNVTCNSVG